MTALFCSICQKLQPAGSRFCRTCGTEIGATRKFDDAANNLQSQTSLSRALTRLLKPRDNSRHAQPTQPIKSRRWQSIDWKKPLVFLVICIVLLVLLAPLTLYNGSSRGPEERLAAIRDPHNGMPQLNREFNHWINPNINEKNAVVIDRLTNLAARHPSLIADMKACESELSKLESPYEIVALYDYFAMAYYQLSAISSYLAQHSANVADANRYNDEAKKYARMSIEYADKGLDWNTQVTQRQLAAPASNWWTQDKLESDIKRLLSPQDRIDAALRWYRTAGRAILAYYNEVPFNEVYAEVESLKDEFQHQDPPEDDPTMRWVLTSENGERPQGQR